METTALLYCCALWTLTLYYVIHLIYFPWGVGRISSIRCSLLKMPNCLYWLIHVFNVVSTALLQSNRPIQWAVAECLDHHCFLGHSCICIALRYLLSLGSFSKLSKVQCCLNISFDDENLSQGEKYQRKFISFSFFKK